MTGIWDDYARFHKLALETWDVDPTYPVLNHIADELGLSLEDRIRLVMRFVAYYHIGSGLAAFTGQGPVLPCATERRGHRDPRKLVRHLNALEELEAQPGGWTAWLNVAVESQVSRQAAWGALNRRIMEIYGNGRWAAYKTSEILWKVCGFKVEATDMGHAYSTGPRHGLDLLIPNLPQGNSAEGVRVLDEASERICTRLRSESLVASVEEVETTLCDFHALHAGRYYVGHDIDQMLRQLLDVQSNLTTTALRARLHTLPHAYLGEIHGWTGPDVGRKQIYRKTGKVVER